MKPTILFEDNDLLVVTKPADITVNRSDTTKGEETVQDWSEKYLQIQEKKWEVRGGKLEDDVRSENNNVHISHISNPHSHIQLPTSDKYLEFLNRAGVVHRLDKETSGVLLIAKNPAAFSHLQAQFKERTVKKRYVALAHGTITPPDGEVRIPVGRLPWNRKQFGIVAGGREAVTKYKVISNYKFPLGLSSGRRLISNKKETLSLVELYPETGRTHQIRVHLKYIGHPIFADFLYAGRKTARNDRKLLSRVFLHAAKISFLHPTTAAELEFESPLPEELQTFLNSLEKVD